MNIPAFSVRRPVFVVMVALMIAVLGTVSLFRLRIDLLPSIELPTASIQTQYEGASPEVMERLITQIIEEITATVPGVEEIRSVSMEGQSRVNVTFVWGTDLDAAAIDLRATIEDEINELPDDIVRPRINKFNIDTFPVVLIGVSSPLDPIELTELIEDRIRHRFTRIPGVAQVDLWGGFPREIRMELIPERITALGLSFEQIIRGLENANIDLPAGQIEAGRYEVSLRAPAQFTDVSQMKDTVVSVRDGVPITVGDVAEVNDTYSELTRVIRVNGEQGIRIAIRKQADANTVEVADIILKTIAALNEEFPQIHIVPVINQGNFIERSIENVSRSVFYGGGLAVLVLLFFLRSFRSTFVIAVSIPLSVVATFALIYFSGMTLNLMTLGGLALGVGMMVDSSIVVLENIFRRRDEEGESSLLAASRGAQEVVPAIVASTITTLVIFLPIVFVQGVSSLLFRELAYVIVFALMCALLVAMTLVPMLASRFGVSKTEDMNENRFFGRLKSRAKQRFSLMTEGYIRSLSFALKHPVISIAFVLSLFVGAVSLIPLLGTEFLPPSDEGEVRVTGEMEVGTRLSLVDQQTQRMEAIVFPAVPEAVSTVTSVRENIGEIRIALMPAKDRGRSNTEIADELRKKLAGKIPGMTIRTRAPQGQFLLERLFGGSENVVVEICGYSLERLRSLSLTVAKRIENIDGITDVKSSYEANVPQQELVIDRAKMADLGLTAKDVTQAVETAFAGGRAGNFRSAGNSYRILVKFKNAKQRSMDEVLSMTVQNGEGNGIPLSSFVSNVSTRAPLSISRKDQQRIVTVTANVAGRDLGSVATDIQSMLSQIQRPDDIEITVGGNYEEQQKSFEQLKLAFSLALLLVFMVLAAQYESLKKPIVVMCSTPMALIGVTLLLWLTHTTINLQSAIGAIMLGGIVVNNAILLVDQTGRLSDDMPLADAIVEAARRRFRPILMTSFTTILGLLPLALGIGEGADAQAPMARVVVGGLFTSTFITLLFIPVVYQLFYRSSESQKKASR